MNTRSTVIRWMVPSICAALGLAAGVLALFGGGEEGIKASLHATGRLAFLLFWPAYAGSALAALFGPMFQPWKQHAPQLGLAFASVLLVHLGLVGWLCLAGAAPSASTFVFFGIGAALTYLLALFSIGRLQRAIGPGGWWLLRVVGLNYIAYAFAVDFLQDPLHGGIRHVVEYLPFAALAVAGPSFVLAALMQRVARRWADSSAAASARPGQPACSSEDRLGKLLKK